MVQSITITCVNYLLKTYFTAVGRIIMGRGCSYLYHHSCMTNYELCNRSRKEWEVLKLIIISFSKTQVFKRGEGGQSNFFVFKVTLAF